MRELSMVLLLLLAPLLAGCLGGDEATEPQRDLQNQATASDQAGGIEGVVTDPAIQPVAGATVTIEQTSATTTTASDGSFAFSNVLPGSYTLRFEADGFLGVEDTVDVVAGEVAILDVLMAHERSDKPFMQQLEFTGFVECSVRAGFGFAACGAVNLVAGGNATNDRFLFTWEIEPNLHQMVAEIQWESNQPAGQWLSFAVEPDGLSNDEQTHFGDERGQSPLIIRADHQRVQEIDANATAICEGEKEPEDPVLSNTAEAYCNRAYAEEGGPVQARIFVDGDRSITPLAVGAAAQQEYHVIVTLFYNAPACDTYSVFEGDQCPQQSAPVEE